MKRFGRNGLRRWGLGIVAGAIAFVAVPGVASAATVRFDGSTIRYTAASGETNHLGIIASGTDVVLSDPGAGTITDGDGRGGCSVSGDTATCPLDSFAATQVNLGGGDDTASATGNLAAITAITVDGSAGADTIGGSNGSDVLLGGSGADFLDANQGADTAFGGPGTDTFQWDPGDGSDVLEGQENRDTLRFNGSNINEQIALSANGSRLRMTRDIAAITLDADNVEAVNLNSLGGADTTTVDDLTTTDVTDFTDDFSAADSAADQLIVNGTAAADHPSLSAVPGGARVNGLAPRVTAISSEPTTDRLVVNGFAGDDQLTANPAVAAPIGVHFEGGADTDTAIARGTADADAFAATANGSSAFVSATGTTGGLDSVAERLNLAMSGGDDTASATGNLAAITAITVDGSAGADTIGGSNGSDVLLGGSGADFLDANQGADTAFGGPGTDTFQWDPGDGSDVLEGQENRDTLRFNGSNINEQIALSANGSRLRMTRDIAAITLDADNVEAVNLNSLGGADTTTVDDLTTTDVTDFTDDFSAADSAADQLIVNGTAAADHPSLSAVPGGARVNGLAPRVTAISSEPTTDRLVVNGLAGDDQLTANPAVAAPIGVHFEGGADTDTAIARGTADADAFAATANGSSAFVSATGTTGGLDSVAERLNLAMSGGDDTASATGNLAAITAITVDGSAGADTIGGSNGADVLLGGPGADFLDANQGADTAFGGPGTDTFQWDPGDGSDVLEGQENRDTLRFNGSNINEQIALSANGSRLRMTRDIAAITLDADNVEAVDLNSLGGADTTTVDDLTTTDVTDFTDDLAVLGGGGDGAADQVIVNATEGDDVVRVAGSAAAGVDVTGLAPRVHIRGQEPAGDGLTVHTLGGTDTVNTTALDAGAIQFFSD